MTETITHLRITLSDTDPAIWRTVDVPVEANLKMLHDIIQAAMGWQDYHLWEFEADDRRYGLPDPEWPDDTLTAAKTVKLKTLIDRGIRQLDYTYDMGDDWHHTVVIEAIGPGNPTPNIRATSMAPGAARPKTAAAHRGSRPSSTPSLIPSIPITPN